MMHESLCLCIICTFVIGFYGFTALIRDLSDGMYCSLSVYMNTKRRQSYGLLHCKQVLLS